MNDDATLTTDDLTAASAVTRSADDATRFRLRVPEGWHQGRGAFGGLVMGAMTRAMAACEPDSDRPLRSLTGAISAPVLTGAADIEVTPHRRGTAVSTYAASLTQGGGEILAHATAIFGKKRQDSRRWTPPAPVARPWSAVDVVALGPPLAPEFTQHFELRPFGPPAFAGTPLSRGEDAVAEGYLRPRRAPAAIGAPEIVAMADVWWPATFAIETAPRPIATVAFTVQVFLPDAPLDPGAPLLHRARSVAARDGYVVEMRELWSANGALLALNQQTFVMIR